MISVRRLLFAVAACLAWHLPAAGAGGPTCFGPGADAATAQAAVYLVAVGPGSEVQGATGTVVRDSAPDARGHNRILSAYHVLRTPFPQRDPGVLQVYSSDGRYLGQARLAARGSSGGFRGLKGSLLADPAVFAMTQGEWRDYDSIRGLDLAPRPPSIPMAGEFSAPGAVARGASGAAATDPEGRIAAVVSTVAAVSKAEGPLFAAGSIENVIEQRWESARTGTPGRPGKVSAAGFRLPAKGRAYLAPIGEPSILAALGPAGRRVSPGRPYGPLAVHMAAYPHERCVVYSGVIRPFRQESLAARVLRLLLP